MSLRARVRKSHPIADHQELVADFPLHGPRSRAAKALVFGAIAVSIAVSGVLADAIGAGTVLVLFGGICAAAGVIGLLLPSMRNAR